MQKESKIIAFFNWDGYEHVFLDKYKSPHRVLKRAGKVQELQISCLQRSSLWPTIAWEENVNALFWSKIEEQTEEPKVQKHFSTTEKKILLRHGFQRIQQIFKKETCSISSKGNDTQGMWLMPRIFLHWMHFQNFLYTSAIAYPTKLVYTSLFPVSKAKIISFFNPTF